jgi:polygalacturonase
MLCGGGLAAAAAAQADRVTAQPVVTVGPTLDVRDFGAAGSGGRDDTRAIQDTIDTAARLGGGIVRLPAGTWLSGTLALRSRVTIDLAPGATLLGSADDAAFAARDVLPFRTGSDAETTDFAHALLAGRDLEQVAITGGGVIDMSRRRRGGPKPIALKQCRFVTVRGLTITRSPNYCVSLGGCDDVLVDAVTIREAFCDGIDVDCCRRVRIANCDVEADDDALCLKTSFTLGARHATEDVVVTNCRLRSPSNCFKLGTESSGDFRQIVVTSCLFSGLPPAGHLPTAAVEGGGIAILTVDGGTIDGVLAANLVMRDVAAPIFVRLGRRGRDQAVPAPGRLTNVTIHGVVATGAAGTSAIAGVPGSPIEGITLENVRIATVGGTRRAGGLAVPEREAAYPKATMFGTLPAFGLYVRHARGVTLRDVQLPAAPRDPRCAVVADDVDGLHLAWVTGDAPARPEAAIWLHDVRGGLVHAPPAPGGGGMLLRITGERTRDVSLAGGAWEAPASIELGEDLLPEAVGRVASVARSIVR